MFPSPVQTYHTSSYPAIDPTRPELSTKGKNIVIAGGGTGIGRGILESFAKSGASNISILGRTEKALVETKAQIETEYPATKVLYYSTDIVDRKAVDTAFNKIKAVTGPVDVLIANSGFLPDILPLAKSNPDDWFNAFEVNVKGNLNLVNAFIRVAAPGAALINITSGAAHLTLQGYSGYASSKIAAVKLFDYVHQEYPDFFVLNVHPGVIKTAMEVKNSAAGGGLPYDEMNLPSDYVVWSVSPEASFLNGKFVWVHWDIDELQNMKAELDGTPKFTIGLLGWA